MGAGRGAGSGTGGVRFHVRTDGHETNPGERAGTGLGGGRVAMAVFCVFWTSESVFNTTKCQVSETSGRGKVLVLLGLSLTPHAPDRHGAA